MYYENFHEDYSQEYSTIFASPAFFFFFFSIPFIIFALLCSLLLVVTQIRGHIAGSYPPLPTTVRALHFYREKISALLASSTRIVLTHARRSQADYYADPIPSFRFWSGRKNKYLSLIHI